MQVLRTRPTQNESILGPPPPLTSLRRYEAAVPCRSLPLPLYTWSETLFCTNSTLWLGSHWLQL